MEFIKVKATQCDEDGNKINRSIPIELYLNPDTIKAITPSMSIILKKEPDCVDDGIMAIGKNYYNSFEFVKAVSLIDLNEE